MNGLDLINIMTAKKKKKKRKNLAGRIRENQGQCFRHAYLNGSLSNPIFSKKRPQ